MCLVGAADGVGRRLDVTLLKMSGATITNSYDASKPPLTHTYGAQRHRGSHVSFQRHVRQGDAPSLQRRTVDGRQPSSDW
jgi:hypothetical protein